MFVARNIDALFGGGDEPRCYLARRFLFWAASTEVGGHAAWGAPDRSDTEHYVRILQRGVSCPQRTPARLIIDFRDLRAFDADSFHLLARYFADNKDAIDRDAVVVRPGGRVGAMVAGFFSVVEASVVPVVTDLEEACERLGVPEVLGTLEAVYRLRDDREQHHATVDRLREQLARDEPLGGVTEVARALHMSSRTLQHQLRAAGTSFRRERTRARLERAVHLLGAGVKLAAVALEVGFSTPQHFATWFKRETGKTPSEWRAQLR